MTLTVYLMGPACCFCMDSKLIMTRETSCLFEASRAECKNYLEASSLLHQEGVILLLPQCFDLLGVALLCNALMHHVAQQHLAVQCLGSVRVIVQHLVCGIYLFAPQLCPFFCISLINLNMETR